jgi:RNA polymerase sigma factor (sigma-70 family)
MHKGGDAMGENRCFDTWNTPGGGRLTADEERSLGRRIRAGDMAARAELVSRNAPLAMYVATRMKPRGCSREDMAQIGILGLYQAVDHFDPERGVQFATYAVHWIHQAIRLELWQTGCLVRVPQWACDLAVKAAKVASDMPEATPEAVAKVLGFRPSKVKLAVESQGRWTILDADHFYDGDVPEIDHLASDQDLPGADMEAEEDRLAMSARIAKARACLSPREDDAIDLLVLGNYRLRQFGDKYGKTREWARLTRNKALNRLRKRLEAS